MADLAEHAVEDGPRLLLDRAADLAETERTQRAAVALALADLAPDLGDANLRHHASSFFTAFRTRLAMPLAASAVSEAAAFAPSVTPSSRAVSTTSFAFSAAVSTTGAAASTTVSTMPLSVLSVLSGAASGSTAGVASPFGVGAPFLGAGFSSAGAGTSSTTGAETTGAGRAGASSAFGRMAGIGSTSLICLPRILAT